ncbi:unnamed protein product, partial [Musa banksii]
TCTSKEGVKKPSKVVAIGCWVQLHLTTHVVFKWRTEVDQQRRQKEHMTTTRRLPPNQARS